MNDKAVCRTAPATQGLLITELFVEQPLLHRVCCISKPKTFSFSWTAFYHNTMPKKNKKKIYQFATVCSRKDFYKMFLILTFVSSIRKLLS